MSVKTHLADSEVPLTVGSTVWIFDENRRVYPKEFRGAPIYREHFTPVQISSETSRSWVIRSRGREEKIDKKTLKGIFPTQESVDEAVWIHDNAYQLGQAVGYCRDIAKLKRIALIMDWNGTSSTE